MLPKTTLNILKYNDKFEILSVVTDKTNYYYSTNYFYLTNNKNCLLVCGGVTKALRKTVINKSKKKWDLINIKSLVKQKKPPIKQKDNT